MTQEAIIKALKKGPLSSVQLTDLLGVPRSTVISAAQTLRDKGILKTGKVKVGRFVFAQYTLIKDEAPENPNGEKIICGIKTYGIFTPAEYRVMNAQARRLYQGNPQFTTYSKAKPSENSRQV